MTNNDQVGAHASQAREFLGKAQDYLATGDLHQASEKGWGAAAHMAKAVALTQGWPYERHSQFHQVMNRVTNLTGNDRLRPLHGRADVLHVNFYELKDGLDQETIRKDLSDIAELLEILEPLTGRRKSPEEDERAVIRRTIDTIRNFTGVAPRG